MQALKTIFTELVGLFVDDWRYVGAIVLWLAAMTLLLPRPPVPPMIKGPLLFVGLAAILLVSVAGRRRE